MSATAIQQQPQIIQQRQLTLEFLPKQGDFMAAVDKFPYAAYIGGVGSGKTHTLCLQALREASIPRTRGLIGAPSYRMLADVTMKKFFELCPPEWIERYHISRQTLHLKNGSEIIFRSFDNSESLQGHDLDWFGGDEMGLVPLDVYNQMQFRLRRPGGRHKGFVVGNPAGPTHWTYDYFIIKAQEFPDTYNLTRATSYENTFTPQQYKREMEISLGKDSLYFKRFVLGEFVAFEGAYWPNFNISRYPEGHVVKTGLEDIRKLLRPRTEVTWNFGRVLDFGFEHPFVILWWVHDGKTIIFYDEYYQRHGTIKEHMLARREKEKEHREWLGVHANSVTWTDHDAQGRHEIHNCRDVDGNFIGFECSPAEKNTNKGGVLDSIVCVQALIQQNRLYISERCSHARLEIPSYRAKPIDESTKEQPIKEKDDTCDCIRMSCWMEMRGTVDFTRVRDSDTTIKPPEQITFTRVEPANMNEAFSGYGPEMLK